MEEPETEIDRPCDFIDVLADCDRSHHHHHLPDSLNAMKEERESINGSTIGVIAYSPSTYTEDKLHLGCFYTPSNHGASPSSPSSPSSSQMAIVTRHSNSLSPTPSDFKPPAVEPAPTPLLSPAAPTTRGSPSKPREERLEAQSVVRAASTVGGGQCGKASTGKKSPKSVSRLCFPFVTTSKKKKNQDKDRKSISGTVNSSLSVLSASASHVTPPLESTSSPPLRHKYSCSPTRFSPLSGQRAPPVQRQQRHAYANHGYSHEALEHVKWFWDVRREGGTVEKKPQFARTVHPQSRGSVGKSSPRSPTPPSPSTTTTTDPDTVPASIHPRHGDISALRDPHCVDVDRTFGAMGVWTIAKMVWMVEVDVGVERMEREREKERRRRRSRLRMKILWDEHESDDGDGDEGGLDDSNRTTSLSSLSDDSEMTLVEDESASFLSCLEKDEGGRVGNCASDTDEEDDEGLQMVIRGRKLMPRASNQAQGSGRSARSGPSSTWTTPSVPGPELLDLDVALGKSVMDWSLPRALYQSRLEASMPTKLTGSGCCQSEWATDWTSRWEIVRNLSREVGCS